MALWKFGHFEKEEEEKKQKQKNKKTKKKKKKTHTEWNLFTKYLKQYLS